MKNHIVHYVTKQYMKQNRKRTMTAFFGIVFMVLLMTCVFVGKDTAIYYMEKVGAARDGKWHASIYDVNGEELSEIEAMDHVAETAVSKSMGITAFKQTNNSQKPYLNVRAYSDKCFDWMNIELSEGRLPASTDEIILSESAREDGSQIRVGDELTAAYFTRSITGISEGVESTFPFYEIIIKYGETVDVSGDFPYYGENDSFRENINYTGATQNYRVVGFMKAPAFENRSGACYEALTWISPELAEAGGNFNVSLMFDLSDTETDPVGELTEFTEKKNVVFNNYVLTFSGNSSDSTMNLIVNGMTLFFLVIIVVASVILIYNLFNMSFEERSRYLGMLCSVGATGRQKRSSVYFEAFYLLLFALPTGFIVGLAVVQGGMLLLAPFVENITGIYGSVRSVPVSLNISPTGVLCVAIVSLCTVFISAYLPARKISQIGPIECIRGNENAKVKSRSLDVRQLRRRGAEGMLAGNSLHVHRKKTRGIIRSAVVFMVIFIVTAFSVQNLTRMVSYRMADRGALNNEMTDYDYIFGTINGEFSEYEAVKKQLMADDGVEAVREWYDGVFIGSVPNEVFSQEYWEAVHKVFNLYYHRELTDEEFKSNFYDGHIINVMAVDEETFEQIMSSADVDKELAASAKYPAIVVQDGEISTENWSVYGHEPEKYQFYQIERMTDLEKGEIIPMVLYSSEEERQVEFPLTVAGYASNDQLKGLMSFHTEQMWVIVPLNTGDAINEVLSNKDESMDNYHVMQKHLFIRLNGKDTEIIHQIENMPAVTEGRYFLIQANFAKTLADSMNAMIRILLYCFVFLASVICLLSLYNAIRGKLLSRRQEFAMMKSMGATKRQMRKALDYECEAIVLRSVLWAVLFATPLVLIIRMFLMNVFGYVRIVFPWPIYLAAALITAIIIVLLTQSCFSRMGEGNILEDIREERE